MTRSSRSVRCALVAFGLAAAAVGVVPASPAGAATERPCGQAEPCEPVTLEGPLPDPYPAPGDAFNPPGGGLGESLPRAYVEEEFFVSGTVDVFNYDRTPAVRGARPGDTLVRYRDDVPYKTRFVVRRPEQATAFNGTVVVEFMNSTTGFDLPAAWMVSSDYLAREGIVYVGVTTSANQTLGYLQNGCGVFQPSCGNRYASLDLTDNGQEYEIVSQLVAALHSGDPAQVPLPSGFPPVERVFVTGESQQAGSVITHANEFSFPLVDGYVIVSGSRSRSIRGGITGDPTAVNCGEPGALPYPDCVAALPNDAQRFPRTNLPMPVSQFMSERDIGDGSRRQDDTDTSARASFRLVEVAGTPHTTVHRLEILPGLTVGDLCLPETTSLADGPLFGSHVLNAVFEQMRSQVDEGVRPPRAARISTTGGVVNRDAFGNTLGGVRLPEIDVPTARYEAVNSARPGLSPLLTAVANLACGLAGRAFPFSETQLDTLYPNHGRYVNQIVRRTNALVAQGFLLRDDAQQHVSDAVHSGIGK